MSRLFNHVYKLLIRKIANDDKVVFERAEKRQSNVASITYEKKAQTRVVEIRPLPDSPNSVLLKEGAKEKVLNRANAKRGVTQFVES
jgi:hypothetical protein